MSSRRKQSKPKLLNDLQDDPSGTAAATAPGQDAQAKTAQEPGQTNSPQQQQDQQHMITESSNHSNATTGDTSNSGSSVVEMTDPPAAAAAPPSDVAPEAESSEKEPPQYRPQLKPPVKPGLPRVSEDEVGSVEDGSDEMDETDEMGDDFLAQLDQTGPGYDDDGDDDEQENDYDGARGDAMSSSSGKRKRDSDDYMNDEMFDDEYEDEFEAKRRLGLDPNDPSDVSDLLMPFKCKVCGKAFKHRRSLNRHVKLHSGEKNFKCPLCASAFARSDHLKAHLRTHNNTKPYRCTICQCGYNSQAALKVHMSHHHGRSKFRCNECDVDLHSQLALEGHMYNTHGRHASEIEAFNESHANSASFNQDHDGEYRDDTEDIDLEGEEDEGDEEDDDIIIEDEVSVSQPVMNVPNILNASNNNIRPLRPLLPKAALSVSPKNSPTAPVAASTNHNNTPQPPSQTSLVRSVLTTPVSNKNLSSSVSPLKPPGPQPVAKNSPALASRLPPRPVDTSNTYCELCNARFSSVDSYVAHMRNCHPNIYNQQHTAPPAPVRQGVNGGESSVLASKMPLLTNVLQNTSKPSEPVSAAPPAPTVSQITKVIPFSSPINQPPNGHSAVPSHHVHNPPAAALKTGCRIPNCNCADSASSESSCARRSPLAVNEPTENAYAIKETHITCAQCSMTYIKNADYIEHLKREHCVEVFRCMLCKQMQLFDNLNLLKEHFINVHQTKKLEFFRCKLCQPAANTTSSNQLHRQVYHSIEELNSHLQTVHQIQQPSQFTSVFAVAARAAPPVQHLSNAGPAPFGTAARPPAFLSQAPHLGHASNGTPPPAPQGERFGASSFNRCFKCLHCDSDFAQLNSLNQHMLMAHNIRVPPSIAATNEEPLSRPPQLNLGSGIGSTATPPGTFSCQYCRSKFSNRIQLERHLRIHVSSVDLRCNICDRTFENQDQLGQHKLTHCKIFNSVPVAAQGAPPQPASNAGKAPNEASRPPGLPTQSQTAICVYCKQTIENDMQFRDHFKRHNNIGAANSSGVKNNSFICIVCRQTLSSSSEYYLHLRHHLKRQPTQPATNGAQSVANSAQPAANGAQPASNPPLGHSFIARALSGELPTESDSSKSSTTSSTTATAVKAVMIPTTPAETIDKYIYEDKYRCYKCLVKFEEWPALVEHMNAAHKTTVPLSLLTDAKSTGPVEQPPNEEGLKQGRVSPARNGQPLNKTNGNTTSVAITPVTPSSNGISKMNGATWLANGNHDNHQRHQQQNGNENQSQLFTEACEICQIQFDSSSRLQAHLLIKHEFFNSNNVFTCPVCDELFSKPESLLNHTMQHGQAAKIYKCSQCPVSFVFKSQLINHSYVHHPGNKASGPVRSSGGGSGGGMVENRSSLNQYGLKHPQIHQRPAMQANDNHHGPSSRFMPNLANKTTNWSANPAHRGPPQPARQGQNTPSPSQFASNYRCVKCMLEFASLKMYQHHFEAYHSSNPLGQTNANYSASMVNAGSKYTCPYCAKIFASQRNLTFHVRIHTGFRPFECDICQRRFTRRDNLRNHMKCHLDVRPFRCPVCNKGFTRKSHLISHLETHLKSRVHTCQKCSLQFTSLGLFIKHLYSEHSMNDEELLEFLRIQAKPMSSSSSSSSSASNNGSQSNTTDENNDLVIASAAVALMRSSDGDDNDDDDYQSQDSFEGLNNEMMDEEELEMDENQEAAAYLESDLMPYQSKEDDEETFMADDDQFELDFTHTADQGAQGGEPYYHDDSAADEEVNSNHGNSPSHLDEEVLVSENAQPIPANQSIEIGS